MARHGHTRATSAPGLDTVAIGKAKISMPNAHKGALPTKTVIALVRHGATPTTGKILPGRAKGLNLSPQGIQQAQMAGDTLRDFLELSSGGLRLGALYSSPMERARQTAKSIGQVLGVKPVIERDLIECDFGDWTGKTLSSLARLDKWKQIYQAPGTFRFPGGESLAELQARITDCMSKLEQRHQGYMVICVSHADPIKLALCDALGAHLSTMHKIAVATASISVVSYMNRVPTVNCINVTGSLKALERSL